MSHDVRTEIARPAGRPGAGRLAAHSGAALLAGRSGAGRVAAASQRRALAALLGAMFLANVDIAVANIAGPSIRAAATALATPNTGMRLRTTTAARPAST